MSDIDQQPVMGFESLGKAPLGRRSMIRRMAALSVAPAIAGSGVLGFAGSAAAAGVDPRLTARKARYAIHGGKIIDGYFASPRGGANRGVVVVIHDQNGLDARAEDTAQRYALAGYHAIAPDLGATFKNGSYDAQVAEMVKIASNLKHLPHGNGEVRIVAA